MATHALSGGQYESRSTTVFTVVVVMICLSTVFVTLRCISRAGVVKKLMLDDYFMFVAWLLAFGMSFAICYGTFHGLGRHEVDVPSSWQSTLLKSQYVFSVLYNPALMAEKTSILVFYLTLSKTNRTFRWATIAALFVVNAGGLALTLVTILQCNPIHAAFQRPTPDNAKCTDIVTIYLASAPLNIITDLAILFIPMPILTSMRLPKKQKIILVVTFGFGVFVAVVDIVRIAYLQSASTYRLKEITNDIHTYGSKLEDETDFSWYSSFSFMWSAIEVNVGIMCACVPALKPLASRYLPRLLRDDGDMTEKHSSLDEGATFQNYQMAQMHRVPSMPEPAWLEQTPSTEPIEEERGPMDMMDFLTTPDMNDFPENLQRSQTALTNSTRNTSQHSQNFFDFVNMKGKKSFVQMTTKESLFPVTMVTVLFFIWGFEYGLLDVLNQQFQKVSHMSAGQSVSIHSAYYAGYFLGPLTFGRLVLKHYGFAACYTVGLAIYAAGILIFWPAAVLVSFPTFVVVNVLVGLGLSTLEVSANPFIALCGPSEHAEIRLSLSQGFQAIGTVIAPLIARKALFKNTDAGSLVNTQWAYTGIALFTVGLALAFFYVPLPEGTDEELEERSERMDRANYVQVPVFGRRVRIIWVTLALGAFAMWCYVGGQEVMATGIYSYLSALDPSFDSIDMVAIDHGIFAASRFATAGLLFFIKPRYLLAFNIIGLIVFSALAMSLSGKTAVAMIDVVFWFEGPIFSLIFAQTIRGMGRHTKDASAIITAAISGGSVLPALSYVAGESRGVQYSIVVAVAGFSATSLYPILLNLYPPARTVVDPIDGPAHIGEKRDEGEHADDSSRSSIASRALSLFTMTKKKGSIGGIRTEWRERGGSASTDTPQSSPI